MPEGGERLEIRPSPRKLLVPAAAALAMTAASAFVIGAAGPEEVVPRAAGWAGAVFFGAGAAIMLVKAWQRPTVAVLDAWGVELRASPSGRARIPWSEVDRLVIRSVFGQRMLGIALRDPERWLPAHSPAAAALARLNLRYGAPYWLAEHDLPGSCDELAQRIRRFRDLPVERR